MRKEKESHMKCKNIAQLLPSTLRVKSCHDALCACTSTGVVSYLLEAWFAGAEGVCAIGDTVGLISITTLSCVTPTVV